MKAVKLYSGDRRDKENEYKSSTKLEKLLQQSVSDNAFVDSAWGDKCKCDNHCPTFSCRCVYDDKRG